MHDITHDHGHHHDHHHDHGAQPAMSPEETMALLTYMLDHNRHHAEELHDICHTLEHEGKADAAAKLADALHYFDHCNEAMAEAVALAKGE